MEKLVDKNDVNTPHGQGPFTKFAQKIAAVTGRPTMFIAAILIVVVWAATGPYFHYSDTWQLVINTGTTIVTFLMVFLIQHTQNRDMVTMQLKLSELVLALQTAENKIALVEDLSDEELEELRESYKSRAASTDRFLTKRKNISIVPPGNAGKA